MPASEHGALRRTAIRTATLCAAALALLPLLAAALAARIPTSLRRRGGKAPRLIWGPVPLISLKYWSQAVRLRGYPSMTWVHEISPINSPEDFDLVSDRLLGSRRLNLLLGDYPLLARALFRADVFFCFLDGSFLRRTPLWRLEGSLLRLAGKKLVVQPYGGDVAVPGHLGAAEERLLEDYPQFAETADAVRRRVDYYCRWADVVVRNWQFGYLPRGDVTWPTALAIDTGEWPERPPGDADGRSGEVTVIHAPNHRRIKGTDALLEAIDELRADGIGIRLELIERRPNAEVRTAMLTADIVADQFVVGYAMFAIEGMSAGKPVISATKTMPPAVLDTEAMRANPIVDADLDDLRAVLRKLVENPDERRRIGRSGREFALRYHSLEAVGAAWESILDHVWRGEPLPPVLPTGRGEPPRVGAAGTRQPQAEGRRSR